MPKSVTPSVIQIGRRRFVTDAVPDPFDARDLEYRPRLEPLAKSIDTRDLSGGKFVMTQDGNSCTGHALAAAINTVLARPVTGPAARRNRRAPEPVRVSPYMLYFLARRYDEFRGEPDDGSSLRGALKGWFHHGVALKDEWRDLRTVRDLDEEEFIQSCAERPLGAYYRVNALRLDDMQSAINELHAIVASAVIDDGWTEPVVMKKGGETLHVITPTVNSGGAGGHAFAIVGYNEVGFLVQNSWGSGWGKDGFATLPYETWLDNAYDAWVVRPGVPKTPFASGRNRTQLGTGRVLVTAPGVDRKRLAAHVVNIGNDGRLSQRGKSVSSPAQIDRLFEHMALWHDSWTKADPSVARHIVLYAHGGLVSEAGGMETAHKHLNWWLNNRIYPVNFAWQSGALESFMDHLADEAKKVLPFGGIGIDLAEQFDRLIERVARRGARFLWDEMKENALAASEPLTTGQARRVKWPPTLASAADMIEFPAATLTATRLAEYAKRNGSVKIHLVGHSAGSIFHAGLLQVLAAAKLKVDSLTFLAPAIRVDEFAIRILPRLRDRSVARFASFAMNDRRELDDVCAGLGIRAYQKSLLYLVSRALERSESGGEVPLLGMEKFLNTKVGRDETLQAAVSGAAGELVFSPSDSPPASRTNASSHGGFDDDTETMTSVAMRILQSDDVELYKANAALRPNPVSGGLPTQPERVEERTFKAALVKPAGSIRIAVSAEPAVELPDSAPVQSNGQVLEVAAAPKSGRPVVDIMESCGWKTGAATANGRRAARPRTVVRGAKKRPKTTKSSAGQPSVRRR